MDWSRAIFLHTSYVSFELNHMLKLRSCSINIPYLSSHELTHLSSMDPQLKFIRRFTKQRKRPHRVYLKFDWELGRHSIPPTDGHQLHEGATAIGDDGWGGTLAFIRSGKKSIIYYSDRITNHGCFILSTSF